MPSSGNTEIIARSGVALFERLGAATLLSHSAGGLPGWMIAIGSANVRAVVPTNPPASSSPKQSYRRPSPPATATSPAHRYSSATSKNSPASRSRSSNGDNIPDAPSAYAGLAVWRGRLALAALIVTTLNQHGGNAELVHLPEQGITGNTHFPMPDLNNLQIADLLSDFLHRERLDRR